MRLTHTTALTAFIAVLVTGLTLGAHAQTTPRPDPAQVAQRFEQAKARLNLTPEQEAKLRPFMEERTRRMKEIRDKYAGETSRSARRAMFKEARPVQEEYDAKVKSILTDTQVDEWEKMRKEARRAMREQYRNQRAPD